MPLPYVQLHTHTFPSPSNTPHSPLQSEEIHHQNAAPLLFRAVNCKYDSGVRLRALCRNGRCPAVGALSFSLPPPPLLLCGTNEVNLIAPCLASKENCFKRTEAEQTLRLASDYGGLSLDLDLHRVPD